MRTLSLLSVLLVSALLLGGCGLFGGSIDEGWDDNLNLPGNGNNNGNNGGNNGGNNEEPDFAVHASGGTTPTYTWEADGAHSVAVVRADNPANVVWAVAFIGTTDGIDSGVVHGEVPAGSLEATRVEPVLTAGVTYRVSVARTDETIGWAEFTP